LSDDSEVLSLLCAFIPEVPINIVTSIEGNSLKVAWNLPSDNGSPITNFKVFIKEIDSGLFTLENADCDGTDGVIIANKFCYINIPTLLASPYLVDGGDSVYA
jgi:hypothetical protein